MTRIAIFSRKELLADSLALMLNIEADIEASYTTYDFNNLIRQSKERQVDVVLFIDCHDHPNGLKEIAKFCSTVPQTKVLALSSIDDRSKVRETYLVGAAGYVSTYTPRSELMTAIKTVASGQQYFGKEAVKALIDNDTIGATNIHQITKLTNREKEICLLYTSPSPRDQRGSRMPSSA